MTTAELLASKLLAQTRQTPSKRPRVSHEHE